MNILYILGAIGGTIYLIEELLQLILLIRAKYKKYWKYKSFYDKNHKNDDIKVPMGFKTEKEQAEIEARMVKKG